MAPMADCEGAAWSQHGRGHARPCPPSPGRVSREERAGGHRTLAPVLHSRACRGIAALDECHAPPRPGGLPWRRRTLSANLYVECASVSPNVNAALGPMPRPPDGRVFVDVAPPRGLAVPDVCFASRSGLQIGIHIYFFANGAARPSDMGFRC